MTFYESHATQPGARGGTWHLHHVPSDRREAQEAPAAQVAAVAVPVAIEAVKPATKAEQADLF